MQCSFGNFRLLINLLLANEPTYCYDFLKNSLKLLPRKIDILRQKNWKIKMCTAFDIFETPLCTSVKLLRRVPLLCTSASSVI